VAVDDLSLEIADGEFMILVGSSGCGKTTALRMIAGLETPTSGAIRIGDRIVNEVSARDRDIAMVFQNYALYPHMTVARNLAYPLRQRRMARSEVTRRVGEVAEMLGLEELMQRRPGQLSGGQRQRVALARAIVNRPKVLLLDEPLGALDLKLRQQMQLELKSIQRELGDGITFIYVTHDQDEALAMSDRIAVFSEGRIEQVGTPGEIYEHPVNEFVAAFVGTSNVLERDGVRYTVRPEKIKLLEDGQAVGASARGTIRDLAYLGSVTRYVVELDSGETLVAVQQNMDTSAADALAKRGLHVGLSWRPQDASALHSKQQEDPDHGTGA
jgi:putative spermidine/putrescine transport system ATP-binding protein